MKLKRKAVMKWVDIGTC